MNKLDRRLSSIENSDLMLEIADAQVEFDRAWQRWNEAKEPYFVAATYALKAAQEKLNALVLEAKHKEVRAG